MDRNNEFIKVLMEKTPSELHEYIEAKGKKQKLICPVFFHKKETNS